MPKTVAADQPDGLKASGLKTTLPRLNVLHIFQRSQQRHLSAEDVYKALLLEGADIGLATVYRARGPDAGRPSR